MLPKKVTVMESRGGGLSPGKKSTFFSTVTPKGETLIAAEKEKKPSGVCSHFWPMSERGKGSEQKERPLQDGENP